LNAEVHRHDRTTESAGFEEVWWFGVHPDPFIRFNIAEKVEILPTHWHPHPNLKERRWANSDPLQSVMFLLHIFTKSLDRVLSISDMSCAPNAISLGIVKTLREMGGRNA
jgi:hypothetical protein